MGPSCENFGTEVGGGDDAVSACYFSRFANSVRISYLTATSRVCQLYNRSMGLLFALVSG